MLRVVGAYTLHLGVADRLEPTSLALVALARQGWCAVAGFRPGRLR